MPSTRTHSGVDGKSMLFGARSQVREAAHASRLREVGYRETSPKRDWGNQSRVKSPSKIAAGAVFRDVEL